MRRTRRLTYVLLFAASFAGLCCESQKKKEQDDAASQPAKTTTPPAPPVEPAPWYEGAFQGTAQLSPVSMENWSDAKAKDEAESAKAGAPLPFSIEVVLGSDTVTGSGTARGEALILSGLADASAAWLTIAGETTRGTFVGHGDEKAKTFKGTLRLSRTETLEGKVSTEAYSGELVLAPVVAPRGE